MQKLSSNRGRPNVVTLKTPGIIIERLKKEKAKVSMKRDDYYGPINLNSPRGARARGWVLMPGTIP